MGKQLPCEIPRYVFEFVMLRVLRSSTFQLCESRHIGDELAGSIPNLAGRCEEASLDPLSPAVGTWVRTTPRLSHNTVFRQPVKNAPASNCDHLYETTSRHTGINIADIKALRPTGTIYHFDAKAKRKQGQMM